MSEVGAEEVQTALPGHRGAINPHLKPLEQLAAEHPVNAVRMKPSGDAFRQRPRA